MTGKVGADDYVTAGGKLEDLPRRELLRRSIHPWLDIDESSVYLGRVTDAGEYQLLASDGAGNGRRVWAFSDAKETLTKAPKARPQLAGRWPDADAVRWVSQGDAPAVSEVLALAIHELTAAMEFQRREHPQLLATWAVATYFFPLFLTFPRLMLTGERGCGKSKVLALLDALAWNASTLVTPTAAVLFRLADELRPTLLLDEMEGLSKEDRQEILSVINAGYKAGASVPRCEGEKTRSVEFFPVYGPMALAGIRGLPATTEDRCIPVVLLKGTDRDRLNTEVNQTAATFAVIRSGCSRLALTRAREVRTAYEQVPLPDWLTARARELWKPLLAVASLADKDKGRLNITPDLLALARAHLLERSDVSAEAEALLALATERLGPAEKVSVRPGELADELKVRLKWKDTPTAEQVGAWLRRVGVRRVGRDREGARYEVTREWASSVTLRYPPDQTVTPSPSHSK
jgi:hypothetical protein